MSSVMVPVMFKSMPKFVPNLVFGHKMRGYQPMKIQLWRETAHLCAALKTTDDRSIALCKSTYVEGSASNPALLHCQYRYPSPRRSGPFWARPTPLFAARMGDLRLHARAPQKTLVLRAQNADSARHNITQNKGSNLCNLSVLFSPSQQLARFRHVSTMILNAALQALPVVRSSRTRLASTRSRALLSVVLLARCVTNSRASAAKTLASFGALTIRLLRATNTFSRRSGFPLSGGFAFPTNLAEG